MEDFKGNKIERVLGIYTKLINGETVHKQEEAVKYGVNDRSIQRDIDDVRNYLESAMAEEGMINSVIYDRNKKGYRLEQINRMKLSNAEILAVCKILLDSRAFTKNEMQNVLERLVECCTPKANQKSVKGLIMNELFHYVEPRHKTEFLGNLWTIGQAIRNCQYIEIDYQRTKDKAIVKRRLKPVAIMFSEYYFYLTAFIDDKKVQDFFEVQNDEFPTIYRIDRIKNIWVSNEKFHIPYSSRFEEGEFRKRVQFMFGGKLRKVKFEYTGCSIESVLDRLPTAVILSEDNDKYVIQAEVFGDGIDMWLRGQGEVISNVEYR